MLNKFLVAGRLTAAPEMQKIDENRLCKFTIACDRYFELLLTVLPSMEFLNNPDILEELLPWNESVQKICKAI